MKNIAKGGLILSLLVFGASSLKADIDLYILDTSHDIGVVDLTTDKVTVLGNAGVNLTGLAFTSNGNFYGTSQTALYSLSLTTGAASLISSYPSGFAKGQIEGSVGDGNNLLLGSDYTSNLYAVDVSPFSTSTLSGAANTHTVALAFGSAGTSGPLYATLTTGNLDRLTISGTTITSSTIVGNTGITNVSGLATIGNVTYGVNGTEIYAIDLSTAALTPVFNYAGHGLGKDESASAARSSLLAVPEPGSLNMVLAGILALAFYQSRKRARA